MPDYHRRSNENYDAYLDRVNKEFLEESHHKIDEIFNPLIYRGLVVAMGCLITLLLLMVLN